MKQPLRLGRSQSRDLDAQIAQVTLQGITYLFLARLVASGLHPTWRYRRGGDCCFDLRVSAVCPSADGQPVEIFTLGRTRLRAKSGSDPYNDGNVIRGLVCFGRGSTVFGGKCADVRDGASQSSWI